MTPLRSGLVTVGCDCRNGHVWFCARAYDVIEERLIALERIASVCPVCGRQDRLTLIGAMPVRDALRRLPGQHTVSIRDALMVVGGVVAAILAVVLWCQFVIF